MKYNAMVYRKVFGYSAFQAYLYLYFIFLPCYLVKVMKGKIDSFFFLRRKYTK